MADIIRALVPSELGNHMPHREMPKYSQEVYGAVGEHLVMLYSLGVEMESQGDFLVQLNDGQRLAFSYGVHESVEASSADNWHS